MINNNLISKNSIPKNLLNKRSSKKFKKNFKKIFSEITEEIYKNKNGLSVLKENYKFNFNIKELKKFKKFKNLVIIGMGGSILGVEAIYQFMRNKVKKKLYFLNNIDIDQVKNLDKIINKKKTLFLVISKSGNTIETLSNLFSLSLIKSNSRNLIVISEKKDSALYSLVKKFNLNFVEHKNHIGGRYSVLSEVGIIPSYLMGLNILNLRKNLKRHLTKDNKSFLKDSVVKLSQIMEKKQYTNLIFLNYCPKFEKFLEWCQQLIAESLGKKRKGFLPIISNVPKDHHSLLQLYLDGPRDKIFYIFNSHETEKKRMNVKKYSKKINYLNNKTLSQIKNAQKNAMINTLKKNKIPFREFKFKNHNEETLSELFSYFILETVFLGKLTNIDPFNQPAVEQVKLATIKLIK